MLLFLWILLVSASSAALVSRFFQGDGPAEKLLAFLVLSCSQVVGVFSLLGWLGILSVFPVTAVFSGLLAAALAVHGRKLARARLDASGIRGGEILLTAVVLAAYHRSVLGSLRLPAVSTDGLLYHLPFAAHYVTSRSLSLPLLFFQDIAMTYYPQGGDILYAFLLLSRAPEFLLNSVQVPFALMGAVAVYLLASERAGLSRPHAVAAAGLFALVKPVFLESRLVFVDLVMAGYFLAAVFYASSRKEKHLLMACLSAGLLAGTKNFALILCILVLPLLLRRPLPPGGRRGLLVGAAFFLVFGCASYFRNLWMTGNPVFPAEVSLGPRVVFAGRYVYQRAHLLSSLTGMIRLCVHPTSHTDPSLATLLLLWLSVPGALLAGRRKEFETVYRTALPILALLLYLVVVPPFYHQVRHLLPLYGLLAVSVADSLRRVKAGGWLLGLVLLAFLAETVRGTGLLVLLVSAGLLAGLLWWSCRRRRLPGAAAAVCGGAILFWAGWALPLASDSFPEMKAFAWHMFYGDQGDVWLYIQKNSKPGKRIACVGELLTYPVWGPSLQNAVCYQSVNTVETRPVHEYPGEAVRFPCDPETLEGLYRQGADFETWRNGLAANRADWVLLRKDREFPETRWIREHPEMFAEIFSNPFAALYAIIK